MFEGLNFGGGTDTNPIKILESLLSKENIDIKTDVNMNQIRILCKNKMYKLLVENKNKNPNPTETDVEFYRKLFPVKCESLTNQDIYEIIRKRTNLELLDEVLEFFKVIVCSEDRQSRTEIKDSIGGMLKDLPPETVADAMKMNKGDKTK